MTPDALAKDITFPQDDRHFADIKVGGIAWDLLIRNAEADRFEPEVADELLKLHSQVRLLP